MIRNITNNKAEAQNRPLLILADGLDELRQADYPLLTKIYQSVGEQGVKMILTCRENCVSQADLDVCLLNDGYKNSYRNIYICPFDQKQ